MDQIQMMEEGDRAGDTQIQRLNEAAGVGDLKALYDLIEEDPYVLENMDRVPFVDTPLHTAASAGHIEFAMEIMNLKASFARKLNKNGLSPMHVAMKNEQNLMVLWLLDVDGELVRVKGRGGMTPLHYAAEQGNCDILDGISKACAESIKDVTNQGDTAFHIAAKNKKMEAFEVLMKWLENSVFANVLFSRRELLNWKNKEGDTALHVAASTNQLQVIELLIGSNVDLNVKNSKGLRAVDILPADGQSIFSSTAINRTKIHATLGIRKSTDRTIISIFVGYFKLWPLFLDQFRRQIESMRKSIPSEEYNQMQLVSALIATITYQAVLSPPGGVWQGSADPNSPLHNLIRVNTSVNATSSEARADSHFVGTTVMGTTTFSLFWVLNTTSFFVSIAPILSPTGVYWMLL